MTSVLIAIDTHPTPRPPNSANNRTREQDRCTGDLVGEGDPN
ncbi:hypothetical protein [Lamprocystis purpurea]|nr:hypothetical protein [Lamprocystis purpurea]